MGICEENWEVMGCRYNTEVLLALTGAETDLFTADGHVTLELANRMSSTDLEMLNKLGKIVVDVRRLRSFAQLYDPSTLISLTGTYALCKILYFVLSKWAVDSTCEIQ